jgi:hypothetical protein
VSIIIDGKHIFRIHKVLNHTFQSNKRMDRSGSRLPFGNLHSRREIRKEKVLENPISPSKETLVIIYNENECHLPYFGNVDHEIMT